ncbi:hypothetical protein D3C87_1207660 [compost metagenome]
MAPPHAVRFGAFFADEAFKGAAPTAGVSVLADAAWLTNAPTSMNTPACKELQKLIINSPPCDKMQPISEPLYSSYSAPESIFAHFAPCFPLRPDEQPNNRLLGQ